PARVKLWRFELFRSEVGRRLRLRGLLSLRDAELLQESQGPLRGAVPALRNSCSLPAQTPDRCARQEHRAMRLGASFRGTSRPPVSPCTRTEPPAQRPAQRPALPQSSRGTMASALCRTHLCSRQTRSSPAPSARPRRSAAATPETLRAAWGFLYWEFAQSAFAGRPAFHRSRAAIFPLASRGLFLPRPTKHRARRRPCPADSGRALPAAHRTSPARLPNRPARLRRRGTNPASQSGPAPALGALPRPRRRRFPRARRTRVLAGRFQVGPHPYQCANGSRWSWSLRVAESRTRGSRPQFPDQIPGQTGFPWPTAGGTQLSCADSHTRHSARPQCQSSISTTG